MTREVRKIPSGILAVFALALALRLFLACRLPADDTIFADEPYLEYAQNMAQGRGFWMSNPYSSELGIQRVHAFRPPLFPFLWGCVYNLTNGAYAPIRIAHAVLGALTCVVVVLIGREITPRKHAALLAGFICAGYAPLIWHSVHLMTEPLFIFLSTVCVHALIRFQRTRGWRWLAAAGVAAGLAALSRSVLAGFLPVAAIWIWWVAGHNRRALARAAIFTVTVTAVMAPWIIRNALVLHAFIPTTTDAGHGFYVANNERSLADPRGFYKPEDWAFLLAPGEQSITEVQAHRRLIRKSARYLADNPGVAVRLMMKRFLTFWRFYPNPRFIAKRKVLVYAWSYIPAFVFMLPGAWLIHRRSRKHLAALLLIDLLMVYTVAVHTAILAMVRYRTPLMPFLLIYAAVALVSAWDTVAPRRPACTN